MDLVELLLQSGADGSVAKLAESVGLDDSQARDVIGALAPSLTRSLQKQTETSGGLAALQTALATGSHQQYIDRPDLMQSEATREDGNKILGHLFGSKDVSRNVAAQAARDTGIDASLIKKALPLVAGLAMAAVGKSSRQDAESASSAGLVGLLGGLLSSGSAGAHGVDDLLGLARKFF